MLISLYKYTLKICLTRGILSFRITYCHVKRVIILNYKVFVLFFRYHFNLSYNLCIIIVHLLQNDIDFFPGFILPYSYCNCIIFLLEYNCIIFENNAFLTSFWCAFCIRQNFILNLLCFL